MVLSAAAPGPLVEARRHSVRRESMHGTIQDAMMHAARDKVATLRNTIQ